MTLVSLGFCQKKPWLQGNPRLQAVLGYKSFRHCAQSVEVASGWDC